MVQELVDEVLEHSTILNALARAPQALLRSASPNKPVHISEQYKGQDLLVIAKQTEPDLDSNAAKQGVQESTSSALNLAAEESGIDQNVAGKFPDSTAEYGSKLSGAVNNREIPP
ncbi:hypothetical protein B0A52_08519 [Exophiala mesophila]|uniref:SMP domain-containing protein n=1 Tax=Exophiala mesophila TaxID=212818 RepID=A0A438MVX3_EXOME|nr:hypothetical protein B0A52_08519 [Exophiala mesophila]